MRIIVAGDFCPQDRVSVILDKGNYASVLEDVKSILSDADYSIVNFECPVIKGSERPIVKCGPNLGCSENGVKAIKWAGFDCVTLANNHFLDYGEEGVRETIELLNAKGIDHVGGGVNLKSASSTLYKEITDKKIAIINCCEHEFSIATDTTSGSNPLNSIQQYYAIKDARKNADYVLVIVHGGHEHFQFPSPRMVETYRFFVDAGADAVVNHHQHCFSGYEVYKNKPIFYGLGNFCFDKQNKRDDKWNYGFMVMLTFNDGVSYEIFPYKQCSDKPTIKMIPFAEVENDINILNEIITVPEKLKVMVEQYYSQCGDSISRVFEPINSRIVNALRRRKLFPSFLSNKWLIILYNYILCEAHRDKVYHFLKEKQIYDEFKKSSK